MRIWRINDLETFNKRLKAVEARVMENGIILTEKQLAALAKVKEKHRVKLKQNILSSKNTYYIGNIKYIGRDKLLSISTLELLWQNLIQIELQLNG